MPRLVCSSCGADYPTNWPQAWGKHFETHGHGPTPKCTALVPNGQIAPVPPNASEEQYPLSRRTAMQVCSGQLMPDKGTLTPGRPEWQG